MGKPFSWRMLFHVPTLNKSHSQRMRFPIASSQVSCTTYKNGDGVEPTWKHICKHPRCRPSICAMKTLATGHEPHVIMESDQGKCSSSHAISYWYIIQHPLSITAQLARYFQTYWVSQLTKHMSICNYVWIARKSVSQGCWRICTKQNWRVPRESTYSTCSSNSPRSKSFELFFSMYARATSRAVWVCQWSSLRSLCNMHTVVKGQWLTRTWQPQYIPHQ